MQIGNALSFLPQISSGPSLGIFANAELSLLLFQKCQAIPDVSKVNIDYLIENLTQ
jgi:hypothetical protein